MGKKTLCLLVTFINAVPILAFELVQSSASWKVKIKLDHSKSQEISSIL